MATGNPPHEFRTFTPTSDYCRRSTVAEMAEASDGLWRDREEGRAHADPSRSDARRPVPRGNGVSSGRIAPGPPPALLGVEIGRQRVRLALLDPGGKTVHDVAQAPINGDEGHVELMAAATSHAIATAAERLGLTPATPLQVGATIGFPHCGVGSGPALPEWLVELSRELGEPVVYIGDHGVSYAPLHCLDYVDQVFRSISLRLDRVELAPVAAGRTMGLLRTGTVTLGSGIPWSARILDGEVMEAFEVADDPVDDVLHVHANHGARPVQALDGVFIDEALCQQRGLSPGVLAPAVGVALALHDPPGRNLLDGRLLDAAGRRATTTPPQPSPSPGWDVTDPGVSGPRPRASRPDPDRPRPDGRSGPRPQAGRPAGLRPANNRLSTDILVGALLMLTVVLIVALVLP